MLSNTIIPFIVGVVSAYLGFKTLVGTLAFIAKAVALISFVYFLYEFARNLLS